MVEPVRLACCCATDRMAIPRPESSRCCLRADNLAPARDARRNPPLPYQWRGGLLTRHFSSSRAQRSATDCSSGGISIPPRSLSLRQPARWSFLMAPSKLRRSSIVSRLTLNGSGGVGGAGSNRFTRLSNSRDLIVCLSQVLRTPGRVAQVDKLRWHAQNLPISLVIPVASMGVNFQPRRRGRRHSLLRVHLERNAAEVV